MKTCPHCSARNINSALFCEECGENLDSVPTKGKSFVERSSQDTDNGINEDAQKPSNARDRWFVAILGLVMIIISIAVFSKRLNNLRNRYESSNWPYVNGKVITSEVKKYWGGQSSDPDDYCANVDYSYSVKGKMYSGNTIRFTGWCYISKNRAQRDVHLYPGGKNVLVYYDPDIPEVSVLEPGGSLGSAVLILLYLLISGVFGLILIIAILRNKILR